MPRKLKIERVEETVTELPQEEKEDTIVVDHGGPKVRNTRDASDYNVKHSSHSHLLSSDMWVGSVSRSNKKEYIYNFEANKIEAIITDIPDAMIRLVLELLTNAADNCDASRRMGIDAGSIEVWMDEKSLRVRNYGEPIPVEVQQEESNENKCVTVIDEIFGVLFRGSNFKGNEVLKTGAGKNGVGVKGTNAYSKLFIVKVGDAKRGQEHISKWENNMYDHVLSQSTPGFYYDSDDVCEVMYIKENKPVTVTMPGTWKTLANKKNSYKGVSYVEIECELDFPRFGYEKFPPEAQGIFCRYLIDFSLTSKIPVYFNNVLYDYRSIENYASLYFTEEDRETCILHYGWCNWRSIWKDENKKVHIEYTDKPKSLSKNEKEMQQQIIEAKIEAHIPMTEMLLMYTPNNGKVLSYVNGLITIEGGVHVDKATDIILHKIIDIFNEKQGVKKNDKKKDDDKKRPKLDIRDVRGHVSMILSCRLIDPSHDSQTKTKLRDPVPNFDFDNKFWDKIKSWEIFDLLQAILEAKNYKDLSKVSKKKRGKQHSLTVEPANFAGTNQSLKCCLGLCEGSSSSSYLKDRICLLRDDKHKIYGQDYNGVFELRGVPLNVSKATDERISLNREIQEIERVANLQKYLDYTVEENLRSLNYGFFLCASDRDMAGRFICSLLINIFRKFYPSLLQMGMFGILMTPLLRVKNADDTVIESFFSEKEYYEWRDKQSNKKNANVDAKWMKGLGTSDKYDIEYDISRAPTVICIYDDDASDSLSIAFDADKIEQRRNWIDRWRKATNVEDIRIVSANEFTNLQVNFPIMMKRTITNFINSDLIEYTVDTFFRMIPSYKDGLKRSQRQILYYFLHNWNYGNSKKGVMKVNRIANACAEFISYHHGETSLCMAIVKMGQNYPGSNNMNIVVPSGNFGSRLGHFKRGIGNDNSDPRYINSKLEWWCKYVFKKEMIELIDRRISDNEVVEPIWIPSILPLHLINGISGMATGHSTYIPSYNPVDIVNWLICKCRENPLPNLTPWFKGFKGSVEVVIKEMKKNDTIVSTIATDEKEIEETETEYIQEEKDEIPDDENDLQDIATEEKLTDTCKYSLRTEGTLNILKYKVEETNNIVNNKPVKKFKHTMNVHITELPIGTCICKYVNALKLLIPKKLLKDVRQQKKSRDEVSILLDDLVILTSKPLISEESVLNCVKAKLKMSKAYGMSNIKLIDDNGFPIYFDTVQDVIEKYYETMIELYKLSIEKRLKNAEDQLSDLNIHLKLINLINDSKIIIVDNAGARSEENIKKQLERNCIPIDYYDKIKLSELSKVSNFELKIEKQKNKILEMKGETAELLWIKDLETFLTAYIKHEKPGKKKIEYDNEDDQDSDEE
jgi:DNA topoisomerase-2